VERVGASIRRASSYVQMVTDDEKPELPSYVKVECAGCNTKTNLKEVVTMADDVDRMLVTEAKDGIGTILINRPEARNCMSPRMFKKFIETLTRWADDKTIRVIIVRGAGDKAFCAGADTKVVVGPKRPETEEEKVQLINRDMAMATLMHTSADRIERCPQPVIGAINGVAFATGRILAESCDIRIAADTVVWGEPLLAAQGNAKMTLATNFQFAQRLINLVGLSRAFEIILMSRPIDAQTGYELGLFNMVVPLKDLEQTAYNVARRMIDKFTATALRAVKPIIQKVMEYQTPTLTTKAAAKELLTACYGTEDFIEGTKVWFRGQPPATYTGEGPVRLVQYVDDNTPVAVHQALKTLGIS
jgi:enoyl-CoA hydratase/carnithine racemase